MSAWSSPAAPLPAHQFSIRFGSGLPDIVTAALVCLDGDGILAAVTRVKVLNFVKRHGVVLQAARGPVPSLAEEVVGAPIRGSWWAHPKAQAIYSATQYACNSPD